MIRTIVFFTALIFCTQINLAQVTDSTASESSAIKPKKMWNLDVIVAGDLPLGDMAKRFGPNYRLGVGLKYKSAKNWIFGAKTEFILGNIMKEDSLMINLKTSQDMVINSQGDLLNVGTFERGYLIGIQVGKILPYWQANINSGPMVLTSIGFMQHKVKLFDRDNSFPQLNGDYKKGYDRLTNGMYFEQFIGYAYHATNRLMNFYAGLNFTYGFTKGRRDYLFDVARPDDARRDDILTGIKLGWVLPIYKKNVEETYY